MTQSINLPVTVLFYSDSAHKVFPYSLTWRREPYKINHIGLHHTTRVGQTLFHVFSVTSGNLFFRLKLNTDNLFWTLEEVSDAVGE
jgi:hypothetical protein